ncbi:MAG: transcriptional regulator [Microscillaceae bacterium]|jgi:DNA-binding transcriptional regulator GbsR (MarR family)|nr:transcriptional regulator [Microscillaceae bacterium]
MTLDEAKEQFIQTWGTLGSNWGINRTMAQIHALLMISPTALSSEEIQNKLVISIGNANMNLRELIAWGLVYKELKPGDRKEYFAAHKDIWHVAQCIIRERKRRELDPVRKAIETLSNITTNKNDPETKAYLEVVQDIQTLANNADKVIDKVLVSDKNWFYKKFIRFFIS